MSLLLTRTDPHPCLGMDLPWRLEQRAPLAGFERPHKMRIVTGLPRSTLEKIARAELRPWLDAEETHPC